MSISNMLDSILMLKNKTRKEFASFLNTSPQALNNKFARCSFSAYDLLKLAEFCDCELSFTFSNGSKVVLDISDIET
jgi:hypothetical protein